MKRFIIIISAIILTIVALDYAYYHMGLYIPVGELLRGDEPPECFMSADETTIYKESDGEYVPFEIRGVNMGTGEPGQWSTDFSIDKETYLRWFGYIKQMGANTVRIYTIQNDEFYDAVYEYNKDNPDPLYILHGVWVNDYIMNSHRDAYDDDFYEVFKKDCKIMVDVIHGQRKLSYGEVNSAGSGSYTKDISEWVIGYILGVEWDDMTVAYTDDLYEGMEEYTSYEGRYMYTTEDASPFEAMLARVGDEVIGYETSRYGAQRLVAFSNWCTTDPFEYPEAIKNHFLKCAYIDVEHIRTTDKFLAGQFASYHVYPYYPDYLAHTELSCFGLNAEDYTDPAGNLNSYKAYLTMLNEHHDIPVVISEFGVSTGRGMAQREIGLGRNQGNTSESEQGAALVSCYSDIMDAGCAGSCIFSWQDEWFKRTWNTMYAVDLTRTPYWSDYQTNEQYFGLLSFDPGKEESVCYVNGDVSEWQADDVVFTSEDTELSIRYDEKFIYFLIKHEELDFDNETLYIPLDITPKSGSSYCEGYGIRFDRPADFVIVIDGKYNSRVVVQERYEALRSTYAQNVYGFDTYAGGNVPDPDSPRFVNIDMILQTSMALITGDPNELAEVYETGKLRYGNADPSSPYFDSLADFISNGDFIEIKLPWQLLNFADPSNMYIHDDYYDGNYGVRYISIDSIWAGVCTDTSRITMAEAALDAWGNYVTYHERLKSSYYIMKDLWNTTDEETRE